MRGIIKIGGWRTINELIRLLGDQGLSIDVDSETLNRMGNAGSFAYIASNIYVTSGGVRVTYHLGGDADPGGSIGGDVDLGKLDLWVAIVSKRAAS